MFHRFVSVASWRFGLLGIVLVAGCPPQNSSNSTSDVSGLGADDPVGGPPTADAGDEIFTEDRDKNGLELVQLTGTRSRAADGSRNLTYKWDLFGQDLGEGAAIQVPFGPGVYKVRLTVVDQQGFLAQDHVLVNVVGEGTQQRMLSAPNEAFLSRVNAGLDGRPIATNQTVIVGPERVALISLTGLDLDPGPKALSFSVLVSPENGTLTGVAPALTYTANVGFEGDDSVRFVANDGQKESHEGVVLLRVRNADPTIEPPPPTDGFTAQLRGDYYSIDCAGRLATVNPMTGELFLVGYTCTTAMSLAFQESSTLLVLPGGDKLIKIDPDTAGCQGEIQLHTADGAPYLSLTGIDIDSAGQLWGVGDQVCARIDVETGLVTPVASLGEHWAVADAATSSSNRLFFPAVTQSSDQPDVLLQMDLDSFELNSLPLPGSDQFTAGLAFGPGDGLYALQYGNTGAPFESAYCWTARINTENGEMRPVAPVLDPSGLAGLADRYPDR